MTASTSFVFSNSLSAIHCYITYAVKRAVLNTLKILILFIALCLQKSVFTLWSLMETDHKKKLSHVVLIALFLAYFTFLKVRVNSMTSPCCVCVCVFICETSWAFFMKFGINFYVIRGHAKAICHSFYIQRWTCKYMNVWGGNDSIFYVGSSKNVW